MSEFKISGCCTQCDKPVFEVLARYAEHERRPGEPKRLGAPIDDAVRIVFGLFDGTKADLTFCAECSEALSSKRYTEIWRKIMRSWLREIEGKEDEHAGWFKPQFYNGLLIELGRIKLKELKNGNPTTP